MKLSCMHAAYRILVQTCGMRIQMRIGKVLIQWIQIYEGQKCSQIKERINNSSFEERGILSKGLLELESPLWRPKEHLLLRNVIFFA
jgi:hypothetical protein